MLVHFRKRIDMIPIPEIQQKLLENSPHCNFSLYCPRMVNWADGDGEKMKDSNAIDKLGKKANRLFQNTIKLLI